MTYASTLGMEYLLARFAKLKLQVVPYARVHGGDVLLGQDEPAVEPWPAPLTLQTCSTWPESLEYPGLKSGLS
jgi:hypothetical protein